MTKLTNIVEAIKFIKLYDIQCNITENGKFDVPSSVRIYSNDLKQIPVPFRNVADDFVLYASAIKVVDNLPEYVGRDFLCTFSPILKKIKTLPKYVGNNFHLSNFPETNFKLFPEEINRDLTLYNFKANNFKYFPKKIHNNLILEYSNITDLEGLENTEVGGDFHLHCHENLTSLDNMPIVKGNFYCAGNINLQDVTAAENKVKGKFFISEEFDNLALTTNAANLLNISNFKTFTKLNFKEFKDYFVNLGK